MILGIYRSYGVKEFVGFGFYKDGAPTAVTTFGAEDPSPASRPSLDILVLTLALNPAWTRSRPPARPCGPSACRIPFAVSQTAQVSPRRRSRLWTASDLRMTVRSVRSHDILKTRRMFLPLLGERAGAREVVATNYFPDPCFICVQSVAKKSFARFAAFARHFVKTR
jgi:hypothetical protein